MIIHVSDDLDAIAEAADDRLEILGDMKRELACVDNDEVGWQRCGCGSRTPNCHCPRCGARLRPPATIGEVRWMRNHGFEPTAQDLGRFELRDAA